jgi:hypothetical protein
VTFLRLLNKPKKKKPREKADSRKKNLYLQLSKDLTNRPKKRRLSEIIIKINRKEQKR